MSELGFTEGLLWVIQKGSTEVTKQPLAVIDDYFNEEITESINGHKFSIVLNNDKSLFIQTGNLIKVEGQWFNIVKHRRTRSNNGALNITVECEQVAYDLLFTVFEGGFIHTGSPATLLKRALQGTIFTVGTMQPTGLVIIDLQEGVPARAILLEIAAQCGGELLFYKYTVSFHSLLHSGLEGYFANPESLLIRFKS